MNYGPRMSPFMASPDCFQSPPKAMKKRTIAWILGLCAALLTAISAQAQPLADDQRTSLRDALELAWARHPQAAAMAAREAEAGARAEVAAGITPGPASVSLSSLGERLLGNHGKQEWEVEMAAPLWLPGQQAAREDEAASAMAEVATLGAALRLQVAGEVREAWWAVAAARNERDLAERRIVTARAVEADVMRRLRAGDLARSDANLAQDERLAAQAEAVQAQAALLHAEQAWRNLTGAAAPAVLVAERAAAASAPRSVSPQGMGVPLDHPQLAALAATARTARARLRVAEATRRDAPEFAVRVARDRDQSGEPFANTVGVKLTIPFSSGARVRQDSAAVQAEVLQADAELALARLRLTLEADKARLDLDAAERQLAMARERRELTADNLSLAEKSFSLGESDLSTLLRARAGAFEAETAYSRQQVARAAALSRLQQALGVLP